MCLRPARLPSDFRVSSHEHLPVPVRRHEVFGDGHGCRHDRPHVQPRQSNFPERRQLPTQRPRPRPHAAATCTPEESSATTTGQGHISPAARVGFTSRRDMSSLAPDGPRSSSVAHLPSQLRFPAVTRSASSGGNSTAPKSALSRLFWRPPWRHGDPLLNRRRDRPSASRRFRSRAARLTIAT